MKKEGYITVYLALTTGIILSLFLTLIEGIRVQTMRMQIECVADMALDSALAEYHQQMLLQYDLFFIDTSYGGNQPSFHNTEEHIRQYADMNFQPWQHMLLPVGKDLTGLSTENVELLLAGIPSDEKGSVLQYHAISYIKNRYGISAVQNLLEAAGQLESSGFTNENMEEQWDQAEAAMKEEIYEKKRLIDENWNGEIPETPSDAVRSTRGEGILRTVASEKNLSSAEIPINTLASHRTLNTGSGLWNEKEAPKGTVDKGYFILYLLEKCGCYGQEKEDSAMAYQLEYLLQGQSNDLDNLRRTANEILLIREAANAAYLFSDAYLKSQAQTAAMIISAILALPEIEEALTTVILFAWAYAESVKDLKMLFDGCKVPLFKTADSWNTPFSQLLVYRLYLSDYKTSENGMDYQDYLGVLLFLQSLETSTFRLMDVMEWDIRQTKGNEQFRIDGCIDGMHARILVKSRFGHSFEITRTYEYE